MIRKLWRPEKIQRRVDNVEDGLIKLFQIISEKENLELGSIALVPLARRGVSLLPIMNNESIEKNRLLSLLEEFGYIEKYPLFPEINKILEFDTILLFDDICKHGNSFKSYQAYLCDLEETFKAKSFIWSSYLIKSNIMKDMKEERGERKIYAMIKSEETAFESEIQNVFEFISCKGEIIDPDHMFVRIEFQERQDFFALWEELNAILESGCVLVEDGMNFLHPTKKELGIFVKENRKEKLENLGFRFPEFIEKIEIAKFRMVFELDPLEEEEDRIFARRLVAVPILNPVVDLNRFSSDECKIWKPRFQFCRDNIIHEGICDRRFVHKIPYLIENYYHPRFDCIIYNLVKDFSDHFLNNITRLVKCKMSINEKWIHQERFSKFLEEFDIFRPE